MDLLHTRPRRKKEREHIRPYAEVKSEEDRRDDSPAEPAHSRGNDGGAGQPETSEGNPIRHLPRHGPKVLLYFLRVARYVSVVVGELNALRRLPAVIPNMRYAS